MQVLDSLSRVNDERQQLEAKVARFWSDRQEVLLEAEVRGGRGSEGPRHKEGEGIDFGGGTERKRMSPLY